MWDSVVLVHEVVSLVYRAAISRCKMDTFEMSVTDYLLRLILQDRIRHMNGILYLRLATFSIVKLIFSRRL